MGPLGVITRLSTVTVTTPEIQRCDSEVNRIKVRMTSSRACIKQHQVNVFCDSTWKFHDVSFILYYNLAHFSSQRKSLGEQQAKKSHEREDTQTRRRGSRTTRKFIFSNIFLLFTSHSIAVLALMERSYHVFFFFIRLAPMCYKMQNVFPPTTNL